MMFEGTVRSACGFASSASGPFYCPGDHKLYLDTAFFDQLDRQFGAAGDFAQAYVIAHEVGHHVQNLTGILPKFNQMRQSMDEVRPTRCRCVSNCRPTASPACGPISRLRRAFWRQGDIEEALNAAQQIGDDTLQRRTQGYVVPESFNHGTSEQRQTWFARGFKSGSLRIATPSTTRSEAAGRPWLLGRFRRPIGRCCAAGGALVERRLALAGADQVDEAAEQIVRILRAGRCFRMVLDREDRPAGERDAAVRAVEQRNVGLLDALRQGFRSRPRSRGSSRRSRPCRWCGP